MYLKHKNLTIRNATIHDAEQLCSWWNDGKVMEHAGFPHGIGQTVQEISDSIRNNTDDTHRTLIIEIDNLAVGEMNYRNKGNGIAEIGIKICDFSKQNQGNGKILLSMLIDSLFKDLKFKKIILDTNLKNERAQHVYERLGFTKLRINKDSWMNQIGEIQSSIDYELYPTDFCNFAE